MKEARRNPNAGRKPLPAGQKKVQVTLYIERDVVNHWETPEDLKRWLNWKVTEHVERKLMREG